MQMAFFWLLLLAILPKNFLWEIREFGREVGKAAAYGVSVSGRIQAGYLLAVAGPLALCLTFAPILRRIAGWEVPLPTNGIYLPSGAAAA